MYQPSAVFDSKSHPPQAGSAGVPQLKLLILQV